MRTPCRPSGTCRRRWGPAAPSSTTTTTGGWICIWSTAESPTSTLPPLRSGTLFTATTGTGPSPTSPKQRVSQAADSAWVSRLPTTTATAGKTSTSPTTDPTTSIGTTATVASRKWPRMRASWLPDGLPVGCGSITMETEGWTCSSAASSVTTNPSAGSASITCENGPTTACRPSSIPPPVISFATTATAALPTSAGSRGSPGTRARRSEWWPPTSTTTGIWTCSSPTTRWPTSSS